MPDYCRIWKCNFSKISIKKSIQLIFNSQNITTMLITCKKIFQNTKLICPDPQIYDTLLGKLYTVHYTKFITMKCGQFIDKKIHNIFNQ